MLINTQKKSTHFENELIGNAKRQFTTRIIWIAFKFSVFFLSLLSQLLSLQVKSFFLVWFCFKLFFVSTLTVVTQCYDSNAIRI